MTKIMIVDDEPDIREMINLILSKNGYETDMAVDGNEFLKKVDSFEPDLVTLDVMMPGLTTNQILDELDRRGISLKVILVTVVRYEEEEKKNLIENSKYLVDYVKKPFDVEEIVETVKKHIF